MLISRNQAVFVLIDLLLICLSIYFAYLLRFDFQIPVSHQNTYYLLLPFFIAAKFSSFMIFGMYKGIWRYTSISDSINILKATSFGTILSISIISLFFGISEIPRSVIFFDYINCTFLIALSRMAVRIYFSSYNKLNPGFRKNESTNKYPKKIVIIGAGNSSEKIIREIIDNGKLKYIVMGIFDDDNFKIGATIHGIPILGTVDEITNIKIPFDEIVICIPTANSFEMRRIVALCKATNKPYRTVPTFSELIDGKISIKSIREVSMVDLLGRKEIQLDRTSISNYIYGKKVLVTGAGGSIGSELVRNCLTFDPDLIILLEQSEHNLFKIENECASSKHPVSFQPILGDIRDKTILNRVFSSFQPDVVFHAAAYKHVPIQEENPWEAVLTNIQGTLNLIEVSEEFDVNQFVLVSTDKAVNPTNIMGATKRVAEKLIQSIAIDSKVNYMAVRFGNVIGSSGSVIPTFQEQIRNGGPVTITNPKMERYFMSINEAAQLILQSGAIGKSGEAEIFVLDMGKPVNIKEIAYELIRLSGLEPEIDISIEYIGSRPGEKLYEELKTKDEKIIDTRHEKILMMKNGNGVNWSKMQNSVNQIIESARTYNFQLLSKELTKFIPEYLPDNQTTTQHLKTSLISKDI